MDRAELLKRLRVPGSRSVSTGRIHVLMFRADGNGGVARTVLNLASELADDHDVEIISLFRRYERPQFPVDPRISISYLQDLRPPDGVVDHRGDWRFTDERRRKPVRGWLDSRPTRLLPDGLETQMSAWTDLLLIRRLKTLGPGVLITTRPSLHAIAARFAPPHLITIAQDHLNFESRLSDVIPMELLLAAYRRLDCLAVLTENDAADYRGLLEDTTHVAAIPNAVPWLGTEQSALSSKIVIAGGRLVAQKGFDRLVTAYAPVAAAHPDWQLHIYGNGSERKDLRNQIKALGIGAQVKLKGFSADFPAMLADAAVFAMTSRYEGFPMVLIEAMSKGLPLVSFDCPRGPAEIIDEGKNGYLVPDGDTAAFSQALLRVIEDDEGRRRMGASALADVDKYSVRTIVTRWEELFATLLERRLSLTA